MLKFAVIMQLPDGAGFYAQIIKALATKASVYDRMKEILIVNYRIELASIELILDQYHTHYEIIPVYHCPNSAIYYKDVDDFGFTTLSGNTFLYEPTLFLFTLQHTQEKSDDYIMALSQLSEHIVANFVDNTSNYYIAEQHLLECISGIAKAYECTFKVVKLHE